MTSAIFFLLPTCLFIPLFSQNQDLKDESINNKKEPFANFYTTTTITGFAPLSLERNGFHLDHNSKGFGVNHTSGILMKNFVFLGGGIGFQNFETYNFIHFSLTQQFFILKNKRFSPMISFHQNFGPMYREPLFFSYSKVQDFGIDIGTRVKITNNHFLNLSVSFNYHKFNTNVLELILLPESYFRSFCLGFNLGYSFKSTFKK